MASIWTSRSVWWDTLNVEPYIWGATRSMTRDWCKLILEINWALFDIDLSSYFVSLFVKTPISRILFLIYIQSIWNCNCAHKCRNIKENHPILRTKDQHISNCVDGANRIEVIVLGRNYLQAILFEWDNYCCLLNHSIVGARICECQLSMK